MIPSNPDNQNPLIYRICDALGVFHIVAPVNHTHAQSEIEGLAAALAAKANAIPAGSPSGAIVVALTSGEIARSNKTITDLLNAIAAKQDALTFDSTPTAGSTNPVTSGGVKEAIDEATKAAFGSSLPYYITTAHEKMKVYTRVLHNNSGSTMQLFECIDVSSLPAEERTNVLWNADVSTEIQNNTTFAIRFMRAANGVYCWFDGTFDY